MDAETIVETMTSINTDDSSEMKNGNMHEEGAASKTGTDTQADAVRNQHHPNTLNGNESRVDDVHDIASEALQEDGSSVSNGESYSELSDSDEYESSFVTSDEDECDSEDDWQPPPKKPKHVLL